MARFDFQRSAKDEDGSTIMPSSIEEVSSEPDEKNMPLSKPLIYPGRDSIERVEAISHILTVFLHTDTWDETFAMLKREQSLLLTDIAERLLAKMVRNARRGNSLGQRQRALYLLLHLHLLHQSRVSGIAKGWEEFESARLQIEQSQGRSLKERGILLSYAEVKRAAYDPDFLAGELGIAPNSPNVSSLQKHLRDFLHSSEFTTRIRVEQTPGILLPPHLAGNDPSQLTQEQIALSLLGWLGAPDNKQSRRYLQAHSELGDSRTQTILETMITSFPEHAPQLQQKLDVAPDQMPAALQNLRNHLDILRALNNCDTTPAAIQATYVNMYGGLTLEVPSWLEEVELQNSALKERENIHEAVEKRVVLLREAIARVKGDTSIACEVQAELNMLLHEALDGVVTMKKIQAQEEGIVCLEEACQIYGPTTYPRQYARVQFNLGLTYLARIAGERRTNLEEAIAYFTQAMQIYTLDASPQGYAAVLNGLGVAYSERIAGERRTNLEEAIACFTQALQIYTLDASPRDHADVEINLGATYRERIQGERRANVEESIACYMRALQVYTPDDFPQEYARIQNNLGNIYMSRLIGEKKANQEKAIAHFTQALQVFSLRTFPLDYAQTQNNLGAACMHRVEGNRTDNIETAIACFNQALQIYAPDAFPIAYARSQLNLCLAYAERRAGEPQDNMEEAIACNRRALEVITIDTFPEDYASAQMNLGDVYADRIAGERRDNLEKAIICYQRSLQIYTLHAFPHEYRRVQLHLGRAEAGLQDWKGMHRAYHSAFEAEELLAALGAGITGRDAILKDGGDAAIRDGFALARLSRIPEAAVAIERGRARELAASMALETADPSRINNIERRTRYEDARSRLITAQAVLHSPTIIEGDYTQLPANCVMRSELIDQAKRTVDLERTTAYHQAKAAFDAIVAKIRAERDPGDFLETRVDPAQILQAAEIGGPGRALVYLASTPWGGFAVAAFGANHAKQTEAHFAALDLPHLTSDLVRSLIEYKLNGQDRPIVGGFVHAQEGNGLQLLLQDIKGKTLHEKALQLDALCGEEKAATLNRALQTVLTIPTLARLADQPLAHLNPENRDVLDAALGHLFMQYELERCLSALTRVALRPLAQWLQEEGTAWVTLIPCGWLAAFPLASTELAPGQVMSDLFTTSFAPSARSLLHEGGVAERRPGFYALGDPHPTHRGLEWSEAETQALVQLARRSGIPAEGRVHLRATRSYLIDILRRGYAVDVSCHGAFNNWAPLQSALLLAQNERLTLSDVLGHEVDLRGLRLLILSACQTSILDTRGAYEEVRSLATGMLRAGAEAVLASLWQVDDKATYLLMVRFAQEWFPRIGIEPPAAALARAQHWLRSITNRGLQVWHATALPPMTLEGRREAGSEVVGECERTDATKMVDGLKRGSRYDSGDAEMLVHALARQQHDPDARPYENPIYWAGFQIIGW